MLSSRNSKENREWRGELSKGCVVKIFTTYVSYMQSITWESFLAEWKIDAITGK